MKIAWLGFALLGACVADEPYSPDPVDDPFADNSAWEPSNPFHPTSCPSTNLADLVQHMQGRGDELALHPVSMLGRERGTCEDCLDWELTVTPTFWLSDPLGGSPAHTPVRIEGAPEAELVHSPGNVSIRFAWPAASVEALCEGYTSGGKNSLECTLQQRIDDESSLLMFPTRADDGPAPTDVMLAGRICDDGRFHLTTDDWWGSGAAAGRIGLGIWGRI